MSSSCHCRVIVILAHFNDFSDIAQSSIKRGPRGKYSRLVGKLSMSLPAGKIKFKEVEEVKKEIRALLLSTKHGCTPGELQADYLQMLGENVPFRSFGYENLTSFLRSIPDVVRECSSRNGTILYAVSDSKTKNVHDMVAKQKGKKKERNKVASRVPITFKRSSPPLCMKPVVPSTVKIRLKELMYSYPSGLSLQNFQDAFAKKFQYKMSFENYGFESLESMIASVADILSLENDAKKNIKIVKLAILQTNGKDQPNESSARSTPRINWDALENLRKKAAKENEEKEKARCRQSPMDCK